MRQLFGIPLFIPIQNVESYLLSILPQAYILDSTSLILSFIVLNIAYLFLIIVIIKLLKYIFEVFRTRWL